MIQTTREFAEKLYSFLKDNDTSGHYAETPPEDCIAELENYLSDLHMVKETIKNIEEVADMFDDHEVYVAEAKPLLYGLREIQDELEAAERRRMVGETNYEVINAVHVGDKEIIFAEDKKAEDGNCWFVSDYTSNSIIGQYADCQVSDDFLETVQEFADRITRQVTLMRDEISQSGKPCEVFTAEHCRRNDYSQSIDGKIVAIKAESLRPEYRRGEIQLVLVNGGNGAKANPHGNAVFCYHLNTGEHTRFERYDVQGEVKPEFVPKWAAEKATSIIAERAAAIVAGKAVPPQKKSKDREER